MSNCVIDIPDHELIPCGGALRGGNSAFAFISTNHGFTDPSDPAEWEAQIAAGNVKIVKDVRGDVPAPSPVETDTFSACGPETSLDGYDRTMNFVSRHVTPSNIDFVNAINGQQGYFAYWNCDNKMLTIDLTTEATFRGHRINPASKKEKQRIEYTITWSNINEPTLYDETTALADIFE